MRVGVRDLCKGGRVKDPMWKWERRWPYVRVGGEGPM